MTRTPGTQPAPAALVERLRDLCTDDGILNDSAEFVHLDHNGVPYHRHVSAACALITEQAAELERLDAKLAVIYDGYAVLTEVRRSNVARSRTSPENVSDVLDALARIWRARPAPPTGDANE